MVLAGIMLTYIQIKALQMTSVKPLKPWKTTNLIYIKKNEKRETLMNHTNKRQPLNIMYLT